MQRLPGQRGRRRRRCTGSCASSRPRPTSRCRASTSRPTEAPNAFATGRNPRNAAVCCTEGILQPARRARAARRARPRADARLQPRHPHRLGGGRGRRRHHLGGPDADVHQLFGGGGSDEDRPNPIALLAMALLAPFAAMLIQMAISRTREYDADEDGAKLTGDPLALASALRKLEAGVASAPAAAGPRAGQRQPHDDRQPVPGAGRLAGCSPRTRRWPSGSPAWSMAMSSGYRGSLTAGPVCRWPSIARPCASLTRVEAAARAALIDVTSYDRRPRPRPAGTGRSGP